MTFAHPYLLLLLLLLPLFAWLKGRRGSSPAFLYSSLKLVEGLTNVRRSRAGIFLATLRWLALAIFIFALAQPRLTKNTTTVKASGIDIVVALDRSSSMISEDFIVDGQRVNRFDMARSVLKNFIDKRPSDRIGLVIFGTFAYIATPLTLDHDFLEAQMNRIGIALKKGEGATAMGDGMITCLNRLRDLKAKSKIIILMTDGQNDAGKIDPLTAAQAAQALGVKIYTVGIGMRGTSPVPYVDENGNYILDPFGRKQYEMDAVDIDENTLQKIATMTGGKYYRADNAEKFRQIYDEIDKQEKTEAIVNKFTEYTELFQWFVGGGLLLLLIEIILAQTIFRKLP